MSTKFDHNSARLLRIETGITQKDFAKKAGLHAPDLSKFERGHAVPSDETITKIAKLLEVEPKQLYKETITARLPEGEGARLGSIDSEQVMDALPLPVDESSDNSAKNSLNKKSLQTLVNNPHYMLIIDKFDSGAFLVRHKGVLYRATLTELV